MAQTFDLAAGQDLFLDQNNLEENDNIYLNLGGSNNVTLDGAYTAMYINASADVTQGSTINVINGGRLYVPTISGVNDASPVTINVGSDSWLSYGRNIDAEAFTATTTHFNGSNATVHFVVTDPDMHLSAMPVITGLSRGNKFLLEQEWTLGFGSGIIATHVSYDGVAGTLEVSGPGNDGSLVPYMTFRVQGNIAEGATFTIDDAKYIVYACYLRGTRFSTPSGDILVEDLALGDQVCTASGGVATVKWIGFRTLHASSIPRKDAIRAYPIRIAADALAPNVPTRDLYVSPGHHMFLDGKLIAAMLLVNGKTITQDFSRKAFEYFHVELDHFDILLAEGAPAESYVDTGNRSMFQNADTVSLRPDFGPATGRPEIAGMEIVRDGPAARAIRDRLLKRAEIMTQSARVSDPDLYLEIDGEILRTEATGQTEGVIRFALPAGAELNPIRITSRSAVARETTAHARRDLRQIGVGLARITVEDTTGRRDIELNDPLLSGFHAQQDVRGVPMRWTNGNATIPVSLHRVVGPAILELHVLRTYSYWCQKMPLAA